MSMRRTVLGVMVVCLVAGVVESSPPLYREGFRGDPRIGWPYPDPEAVGENCFGNCGAGCSNSPNPCGGPPQYWVQQMLDEPQFSHVVYGVIRECDVTTGTLYLTNAFAWTAPMRESYHGFRTDGCQAHDWTCEGGFWNPGCWWMPFISCDFGQEQRTWSYETVREGRWFEPGDFIEGGCDICPGGPPCLIG